MPISAVQSRIQAQYNARIAEIENTVSHDAVIRHGNMPDFVDVIAVFAVWTTTRNDGLAADVVTIDEARAAMLCEVFGDMCEITYTVVTHMQETTNEDGETVTTETRVLHITTTPKTYADMPEFYGFTAQQTDLLYEFMQESQMLATLVRGWYSGGEASINMSDDELYELAAYYGVILPDDLSIERKNVLAAAFAGVQINIPYHYNWRGYYRVYPGIEGNDFGSIVTADYKGRNKKGLDCSGFVGWAYCSGGITWSGFGYGESGGVWSFLATPGMRSISSTTQITADKLMPGDIGFISNSASGASDHTGLYLGTTASGLRMWIHCAGSTGTVCTSYNFGVFYTVAGMDATFGERKTGGTVTASDIALLAQLIFYEGRGYNSYCKELIAQVAVNRMNSQKSGFKNVNTIEEVLKQPGQYGYGNPALTGDLIFNADITRHPEYSPELWALCMAAAQRVANGTSRDESGNKWPANVLYQHSFANREALGTWFKSYTDASGIYTEHFNFG